MDDLLAYVRQLFSDDDEISQIFFDAGATTGTIVRPPGGEASEVHPSIIIYGGAGDGVGTCEGFSLADKGTLTVFVTARDNADGEVGIETAYVLRNRVIDVLCGVETPAGDEIEGGLINVEIPAVTGEPKWIVAYCNKADPEGPVKDSDPQVTKLRLTFRFMIMRINL